MTSAGDSELMAGCYDAVKRGMSHVQLGSNKNMFDRTYIGNVALGHVLAADKLDDPSVADRVAGEAFTITNDDPMLFWDFQTDFYNAIYKTFGCRRGRRRSSFPRCWRCSWRPSCGSWRGSRERGKRRLRATL